MYLIWLVKCLTVIFQSKLNKVVLNYYILHSCNYSVKSKRNFLKMILKLDGYLYKLSSIGKSVIKLSRNFITGRNHFIILLTSDFPKNVQFITSKYNKHVKLLQDCSKILRTRSKQLKLAKHRKQEHLVLLGSE